MCINIRQKVDKVKMMQSGNYENQAKWQNQHAIRLAVVASQALKKN